MAIKQEETTPLLAPTPRPTDYQRSRHPSNYGGDDNDDRITILTSNPPSINDSKYSRRGSSSSSTSSIIDYGEPSKPSPAQDDIVARRLNGAPLLTVLAG